MSVALDFERVIAYGQDLFLQAGMLLEANIRMDRRPLYQWLIDPLYHALRTV